jgi:hypothetical protein
MIENFCREKSKSFLRLDCSKHINGLRKYYELEGFVKVAETTVRNEKLVLYEEKL